jgi:hypothetical protein
MTFKETHAKTLSLEASIGLIRAALLISAASIVAITGCQKHSTAVSHGVANNQTKQLAISSTKDAEKPPEPRKFGFTVDSVQTVMCCTDVPGKMSPSGSVEIEGVTVDHWRFLLGCSDTQLRFTEKTVAYKKITRAEWKTVSTGSTSNFDGKERMDLFKYDHSNWVQVANGCSIESKLDRAKTAVPVRVLSSKAADRDSNSGYEISAEDNNEIYTMRCSKGVQSPCVSVATTQYVAVRDGSEIRLCDDSLTVIATFQILDERAR